jgi:hypothetical protein
MIRIKQKHRRLENALYTAEKMASAAHAAGLMAYPREELDSAVKDLLLCEFHDVLPGTSVQEGEEGALRVLDKGYETVSRVITRALFALTSGQKKAKDGEIPIIVYNVPSRTGVDIPVHVYETLSHIPNIIGVKEASTDIVKISRIRNACGPNFSIWTGNDDQAVPAISLGAQGVISVASNVFPEKTNEMTLAALDGDLDTASHLQRELLPLIDMLFCEVNPIPVKHAMKLLGYDCGGCRLPLTALSPQRSKEMVQLLSKQLSIT